MPPNAIENIFEPAGILLPTQAQLPDKDLVALHETENQLAHDDDAKSAEEKSEPETTLLPDKDLTALPETENQQAHNDDAKSTEEKSEPEIGGVFSIGLEQLYNPDNRTHVGSLNLYPSQTIAQVKLLVSSMVGIAPEKMCIRFASRVLGRRYSDDDPKLDTDTTLEDYKAHKWLKKFPDWKMYVRLLFKGPPKHSVARELAEEMAAEEKAKEQKKQAKQQKDDNKSILLQVKPSPAVKQVDFVNQTTVAA